MKLINALFAKLKDLPELQNLTQTRELVRKTNLLIEFFATKYFTLNLEVCYGRDLASDLYSAWSAFIKSKPDISSLNFPAHALLLPEFSEGSSGPFVRWLYRTDSDLDSVTVLRAAVDGRVATLLQTAALERDRKAKMQWWHKRFRYSSRNPRERLRRVARDFYINEHYHELKSHDPQRMRSAIHFLIWNGFGDGGDLQVVKATRSSQDLGWLMDYLRAYSSLQDFDGGLAEGRTDATALLTECYRKMNLVYGDIYAKAS